MTISDQGGAASTIAVSGVPGRVADVNVTIDISHPRVSDLAVTLVSPRGTSIRLMRHAGGNGSDFAGTRLDDEADRLLENVEAEESPFDVWSYQPEGDLADYDGENPNGTWTLDVSDDAPGGAGMLNEWTLELTVGDITTQTGASGDYEFANLPPGPLIVRQHLTHSRLRMDPPVITERVIEPFEGNLDAYLQGEVGQPSALQSQAAYAGKLGLAPGAWIYGGPNAPVVYRGDTISTYVKFGDANRGPVFFGFGASDNRSSDGSSPRTTHCIVRDQCYCLSQGSRHSYPSRCLDSGQHGVGRTGTPEKRWPRHFGNRSGRQIPSVRQAYGV